MSSHILKLANDVVDSYHMQGDTNHVVVHHGVSRVTRLMEFNTDDIYDNSYDNIAVEKLMIKLSIKDTDVIKIMRMSDGTDDDSIRKHAEKLIDMYYHRLEVDIAPMYIDVHGDGHPGKIIANCKSARCDRWFRIECLESSVDRDKTTWLSVCYIKGDPNDPMIVLFADSIDAVECTRKNLISTINLGTINLADVSKCRFRRA